MKKLVLALAAAATIAAASATPASALTILKPTGCCGGWNPQPHWGFGGGVSVGLGVVDPGFSAGYGGDCFYTYRKVLIPNIGIVMKKQLVCG
jgi:hypothetical protein